MSAGKRALGVLLVAVMTFAAAPSALWALGEVPTPGALGIPVNPNASGTKVAGTLTLAYEFTALGDDPICASGIRMKVFAVLRLKKGVDLGTFSDDIVTTITVPGPKKGTTITLTGICFEDFASQTTLVVNLIEDKVIPFFFPSSPSASFEIKSVSGIVQTVGSPFESVSMDIEIAVKA